MTANRDLDVVVFGATGFVGRLTAEYLAQHAPDGVRVGLAGRSRSKLEDVRSTLGARAADWPLIEADSTDRASMEALARSATVVATTVGPYRQYGLPLVEACAANGTHYADLTGEVLFIREAIDRFHGAAASSGARIVTCCGFDSIPSDLGTLLCHQAAEADDAGPLESVTLVVGATKGGASGGTIASMKGQIDEIRSSKPQRKVVLDPYALSPDRGAEPDLGDEGDLRGVEHDPELGWLGPFVMAGVNTRVVRRSNALRGWEYGPRLRYREVMGFGQGLAARAKASGMAGGVTALVAGLMVPPSRFVLDRVLPDPGEGPDEEARRTGFFKIKLHARTATGRRYVARVEAQGDPGYAATAVMLGEAALSLALDGDALPDVPGGVLTPATAMGSALVERLRAAGHTYEVAPA